MPAPSPTETAGAPKKLRGFSELQGPSRFDYTMVLQVDEFWAKVGDRPLGLKKQLQYLAAVTSTANGPNLTNDPFLMFQPSVKDRSKMNGSSREWRRCDSFEPVGYDLVRHLETHKDTVVKVPYTWDFGMMFCHLDAWTSAAREHPKVESVWSDIRGSSAEVSWRGFIEACKTVSEHWNQSKPEDRLVPFTLPAETNESLSCLVLELWASEIPDDAAFATERHEPTGLGLRELVEQYPDGLFQACLILRGVFEREWFDENRSMREGSFGQPAVATRHWYTTLPLEATPHRMVRLPGNRSVRGDWFLSMARGSRSYRIGERAIDILSSHRANVVRLQQRMGLPVRGCSDQQAAELWTPFDRFDDSGARDGHVHYRDLRALGAWSNDGCGCQRLRWLWRSRIRNYERHSRIWRRWLVSMFLQLPDPTEPQFERRAGDVFRRKQSELLATIDRATLAPVGRPFS